jgi:hypothetical protein
MSATSHPLAANSLTIALPNPADAPVTATTLRFFSPSRFRPVISIAALFFITQNHLPEYPNPIGPDAFNFVVILMQTIYVPSTCNSSGALRRLTYVTAGCPNEILHFDS